MSAPAELIKPIGRANLVQEVVRSFADLIMQRHWKPGDLIPSEKELVARFGVGRSTIREAMQSLVIMGVLEIRPGDGSYIREPSSELLSSAFLWGLLLSPRSNGHLTQVRLCIEVNCAEAAAEKRSPETIDKLYALLDLMKTHQSDDRRVMEYDNRFHITIAEATGNPIFVTLVETLQSIVGCGSRSHAPILAVPTTRWRNIRRSQTLSACRTETQRARPCAPTLPTPRSASAGCWRSRKRNKARPLISRCLVWLTVNLFSRFPRYIHLQRNVSFSLTVGRENEHIVWYTCQGHTLP